MLAFSKIMKKYDKVLQPRSIWRCVSVAMYLLLVWSETRLILLQITSRSASKAYLEMVDNSYLGTSDEVCIFETRCVTS